jgi:hypothetical protein
MNSVCESLPFPWGVPSHAICSVFDADVCQLSPVTAAGRRQAHAQCSSSAVRCHSARVPAFRMQSGPGLAVTSRLRVSADPVARVIHAACSSSRSPLCTQAQAAAIPSTRNSK